MEWPLSFLAGSSLHRSLEFRLAFIPLTALAAALIYQGTNAALYYLIGMVVYFWAYSEGEVSITALLYSVPTERLTDISDYLCQALDSAAAWPSRRLEGIKPSKDGALGQVVGPSLRAATLYIQRSDMLLDKNSPTFYLEPFFVSPFVGMSATHDYGMSAAHQLIFHGEKLEPRI